MRECPGLYFSNPSCDPGHCVKLICDTTYNPSDDEDDDYNDLFSAIEIDSNNKLKKNAKKWLCINPLQFIYNGNVFLIKIYIVLTYGMLYEGALWNPKFKNNKIYIFNFFTCI